MLQSLKLYKTSSDLPEVSGVVVEAGLVVGEPVPSGNCKMPDQVRYDTATSNDEADVYNKLSSLKTPFTTDDPKFWFNNFERTIKHFGVKNQTTKYEALISQLTKEVPTRSKVSFVRTKPAPCCSRLGGMS